MSISICIIGGGAAGMVAAIEASKMGAKVCMLEQKEMLGKKILSTGNGRCNLTNTDMRATYFRGEHPCFTTEALTEFSGRKARDYFRELGLLTKVRDTYVYPRTGQAAAVREMLLQTLQQQQVEIHTDCVVTNIRKNKQQFSICTAEGNKIFKADCVILATGGKAAEVLGSNGSGYSLAASFGHRVITVVPALVQLKASGSFLKQLSGVRMDATVSLLMNGTMVAHDTGELQWTDYGISGIPVFQISRFAAYGLTQKTQVEVVVDMLPDMEEIDVLGILTYQKKRCPEQSIDGVLIGLVHKKMIPVLCVASGIRLRSKMQDLTAVQLQKLSEKSKHFLITITGTKGFSHAQVCAGGVDSTEVQSDSMESKLEKGLYIVGELLDIDGMCGGYNLHWAWATGYVAGKAAATRKEE